MKRVRHFWPLLVVAILCETFSVVSGESTTAKTTPEANSSTKAPTSKGMATEKSNGTSSHTNSTISRGSLPVANFPYAFTFIILWGWNCV